MCILSAVFSLVFYLKPFEGEYVVNVYIDSSLIESHSLEGEYRQIDIDTVYGHNLLIISEGFAMISESTCNTKSCISHGAITRPGSMIICAPHNLVIKIEAIKDSN